MEAKSEIRQSAASRPAARKQRARAAYDFRLFRQAVVDSLKKLDPRAQIRNPVMFVVWVGAIVTASLTLDPGPVRPIERHPHL